MVIEKKHYTGTPTMLQLMIEYLTDTPPWKLLIHLFYMGTICFFLSTSYIFAFHWTSIIQIYEENISHKQFSNNLKLSVTADAKITDELKKIMEDTSSMRAYVYRYHNGLPSISNIPFFFQTNTNEVISPGTIRLIHFEQRIPVGIHIASNVAFIANKCIMIGNTAADKYSQDYYFFQSRNANAVLRCPIYMDNGDLFGFIGLDWNHTMTADPRLEEQLRTLAIELGKVFKLSIEKEQ